MSKLWLVHRDSRRREALARLCGLAAKEVVLGGPGDPHFAHADPPDALLLSAEGDLERELDFCHRHRKVLAGAQRLLITAARDAAEVRRLFDADEDELVVGMPSERRLRTLVLSAVAHRRAASLAERRERERVASHFRRWLGGLEVPGLLRALDPALASLPLLVRGVPGSGRALLCRYAELFRAPGGVLLRVHARELPPLEAFAARLRARRASGAAPVDTVQIDEVDTLAVSSQRALADWIRFGLGPADAGGAPLRWLATAAPGEALADLEPDLLRAFAPLVIEVPALADHPETLPDFAREIAADWAEHVGGRPRRVDASAIEALEAHLWPGDRAEIEAILRRSLAASDRDPLGAEDLVLEVAAEAPRSAQETAARPSEPIATIDEAAELPAWPESGAEAEAWPEPGAELSAEPALEPESALDAAAAPGLGPPEPTSDAEAWPGVDDLERPVEDEGLPAAADGQGTANARGDAGGADAASTSEGDGEGGDDASVELSEASFALASGSGDDAPGGEDDTGEGWRRLARSLSHEIRNPLVSIRTFTELLPEHFEDPAFRERFTELVGRDVAHIDEVLTRLSDAARIEKLEAAPVDVSELIEALLDERRDRIGRERLLVLRELEREAPIAWADPQALRAALAGLLDRALASLPERGDLFVATRRVDRAADGSPRLRVLLRHHDPGLQHAASGGPDELAPASNVIEYVLAQTIVEACGGALSIDSTDAHETLVLVDLRTPA